MNCRDTQGMEAAMPSRMKPLIFCPTFDHKVCFTVYGGAVKLLQFITLTVRLLFIISPFMALSKVTLVKVPHNELKETCTQQF